MTRTAQTIRTAPDGLPDVDVNPRWPVIVEKTLTYLVMIEGPDPAAALRRVSNAPYEYVDGDMPVGWAETSAREVTDLDPLILEDLEPVQGPVAACRLCGQTASSPASRYIHHGPSCEWHVHTARSRWCSGSQPPWVTICSCTPQPWVFGGGGPVVSIAGPFEDRADADAAAREHVIGRWHTKNLTSGITTEDVPWKRGAGQ